MNKQKKLLMQENKWFSQKIISWYRQHQRELPWRNTPNPYFIWLSEIILQQTRVAQGLPYYLKFIAEYPTVEALAMASEQEVLRLWQGLGYYSRARNLHQTAKVIAEHWAGSFPQTYTELLTLKGVGSYTAAAIASFAFNEPVAVLDGNVYRVLARVFGIESDISHHASKKIFTTIAQNELDNTTPALYNQAIMEFGAIQCPPANPNCEPCPLQLACVAYQTKRQRLLPVKSKKITVSERFFHYLVIEKNQKIALQKRKMGDIWAEMYEPLLVEAKESSSLECVILAIHTLESAIARATSIEQSPLYMHLLSHRKIQTIFWHIRLPNLLDIHLPEGLIFYDFEEINRLPKSTLVNNYLKNRFF